MSSLIPGLTSFLWTQTWQLACLGAVLLPIIAILSKKRPHLAIILSYLLIAKALLPPSLGHSSSLFHWIQSKAPASSSATVTEQTPTIPEQAVHPIVRLSTADPTTPTPSPLIEAPAQHQQPSLATPISPHFSIESNEPAHVIKAAFAAVWLLGIILSGLHLVRRRQRFRKLIRVATPIHSQPLIQQVAELKSQLGIKQEIPIRAVEGNISPSVIGWWRPVIVLPSQLLKDAPAADVKAILAHELLHIKRGDLTISLAQCLSQILWWFHPIVWMANRRINHLRETCCDGEVLHHFKIPNTHYAQTLINVLKQTPRISMPPYVPSVRSTEITTHRIECLMKTPQYLTHKTPTLGWLAAITLAVFLLPNSRVTSAQTEPRAKTESKPIDSELVFAQATDATKDFETISQARQPTTIQSYSTQRSIEIDSNSNRIFTVKREDLTLTVGYGIGRVIPNTQIHIQATIDGTIKGMNLTPGTRVKKGDILLDLDNETLKAALQQAELDLETARTEARQAETLQRQAILKGRNAQQSAQSAYELHKREFAQKKALFEKALISKDELESYHASTDRLGQQLTFEIESNELLQDSYEQSAQLKELEMRRHELARTAILDQLSQLRIRAPIDGIIAPVTREGDLLVGSRVTAGTPLAQLINPDHVLIKTSYSAREIADIHVGMPTRINVNSQTRDGQIQTIYPTADENRLVTVIVALKQSSTETGRIIPGSRASVYFATETLPGVLTISDRLKKLNVPSLTLYKLNREGNSASRVTIQLGKTGMGRMQISGDIEEGDQLLLDSELRPVPAPRRKINLLDQ